jgi:hypothetical protein
MLLLRTGRTGTQKGAINDMNAYAVFAVNEHLEFLLDEAAKRRATQSDQPSLLERIASAASGALAAMPLDNRGTILPKLEDYPYRS